VVSEVRFLTIPRRNGELVTLLASFQLQKPGAMAKLLIVATAFQLIQRDIRLLPDEKAPA
jgi:hypothetical protein